MPKPIGQNSSRDVLMRLDKRTMPARHLKRIKSELLEYLNSIGISEPSAVQLSLVERAAWLSLHIALADAKAANGLEMSDIGQRNYLAWNNTLARLLAMLGIEPPEPRAPPPKPATPNDLHQYINQLAAAQ